MSSLFFRIIFFLLLLLSLAAGAIGGLMYANTGLVERSVVHAGGMVFFGVILYGWYTVHQKSKPLSSGGNQLYITGLVVIVLPLLYYLWVGGYGIYLMTRLAIYENSFSISQYEESPIVWEGFDQPVGLKITLTLDHPFSAKGDYRYPKLILGNQQGKVLLEAPGESYWKFCDKPVIDDSVCMTYPLWPIQPYPEVVDDQGAQKITYELYPSNLYHRESNKRLCLKRRLPYGRLAVSLAEPVALWQLAHPEKTIDLSERLTAVLVEQSAILKNVDMIQQWFQGMQSDTLLAAGYQSCEVSSAIRFTEDVECFCNPDVVAPKTADKNVPVKPGDISDAD